VDREITMPASLDHVASVRHEVVSFLETAGYPEESAFEVGMALAEALTNAIVHGCRNNPRMRVSVRVNCDPTRVCLVVCDPGPGFDPAQVRDPLSAEGRIAQSGRGIQMMKAFMDDVAFGRGGREVRMRKNWPRNGARFA
jgi:serine/threonine-protein kinase RsbW